MPINRKEKSWRGEMIGQSKSLYRQWFAVDCPAMEMAPFMAASGAGRKKIKNYSVILQGTTKKSLY